MKKWFSWETPEARKTMLADTPFEVALLLVQQQIEPQKIHQLPTLRGTKARQLKFWYQWCSRWLELMQAGFDNYQSFSHLLENANSQQECALNAKCLERLRAGQRLTEVLFEFDWHMPSHALQLLRFAEQAGSLETALQDICADLDAQIEQRKALQAALRYPYFLVGLSFLLAIGLKTFILPRFAELYAQSGTDLPPLTQWLLAPSESLKQLLHPLFICAVCITLLLLFVIRKVLKSERLNFWLWQRLPNGHALHLSILSQEINLLARSTAQNIPLQTSAAQLALQTSDPVRKHLWTQFHFLVQQGHDLAYAFSTLKLNAVHHASLTIAINSGTLANGLRVIALQLSEKVKISQARFMAWLPQIFMLVLSVLTAIIMAALYLPLFQMGLTVG